MLVCLLEPKHRLEALEIQIIFYVYMIDEFYSGLIHFKAYEFAYVSHQSEYRVNILYNLTFQNY